MIKNMMVKLSKFKTKKWADFRNANMPEIKNSAVATGTIGSECDEFPIFICVIGK